MLISNKDFAEQFLNHKLIDCAKNLNLLLETKDKLNKNIINYWNNIDFSTRENLVSSARNGKQIKTSGSMAYPFQYLVSKKIFYNLEINHHYRHILKEFNLLQKPLKILRVSRIKDIQNCKKITWNKNIFYYKSIKPRWNNYFFSHGSDHAECHSFQYHPQQTQEFCQYLKNIFTHEEFDIFLTSFSFVSIFMDVIKEPVRICHLLSNICEAPEQKQVNLLVENKQIDYFCDHMRCWDGGFGFYTCRCKTMHIYEPYIESQTINGKILSTDYFNFNSSFINYWNNDTGHIENKWQICECGKWYRPFKFESNRVSFNLKKISSIELHDEISKSEITLQAVCYKNFINIITTAPLDELEKNRLIKAIAEPIKFTCNNFVYTGSHNKLLRILNRTHVNG